MTKAQILTIPTNSISKCGRCRSPISPHDPQFPAIDTATGQTILLCAHCERVVQRFRLLANESSLLPPHEQL